ncbi:transglycosylase domain-containing protein [Agromyces cerinus]|uniref:Membrane carboxypeptidase (Penicillin-binding protein) n=1 Tax=Agromyces cerinus subsp. cerinus TaxID=232089 RepID=A0A1N6DEM3_9MICO|nr:transglycosylase domain-containing protein [Agromyces cerinus]SIN69242.1 Membrane carboxypeptidase (penicillin-binding protein) [Agromyces cerinus subsp. cerinus]
MSDVGAGILGFVGMSALAGVLVTAAVTPALAVTGMAANNSITMFENLPGYLQIEELAQKSTIYAVNADKSVVPLANFYDDNREEVAFDYISQFLKDAAIAGEDPRFYDHGGIDIAGTVRGAVSTALNKGTQGGSSITQQYVKNVLVANDMAKATTDEERAEAWEKHTRTSIDRKLKEMRYAIAVEKEYPKDEILRGYLDIAGFGGQIYGVQTAASYYFGTNAKDLSLAQAASLIAIVNSPEEFRLDYPEDELNGAATVVDGEPVPYARNKERRDYILGKMLSEKKVTQEQYDAAVAEPVAPKITEPSSGCQAAGIYAYFCDYVTWEIKNKFDDPATEDVNEGARMLERGGLDIYTTIDVDLQTTADAAVHENVPASAEGVNIGGSAVSVEVGTGRILSMAQNTTYNVDPDVTGDQYDAVNYNATIDYGSSHGFQPGSTFKIFTLGEWLNEGHSVNESVDAKKRSNWGTFQDSCDGPKDAGDWDPRNDEGGNGGYWSALFNTVNSENTGFVAMAKQLDLCGIKNTASGLMSAGRADGKPLGEGLDENGNRIPFGPSAVLGTEEVAPVSMATAFAAVAGGGKSCTPIAIDSITDANGEPIDVPKSTCTQAITPDVAAGMNYALQRVMTDGTGRSSRYKMDTSDTPMIGKTGTTDDAYATWMSGASSRVATVVGVYNVTGFVNLRDTYFDGEQAAVLRHNIWPRIMDVANTKYPGSDFPEPKQEYLSTPMATVPSVLGLAPEAAQKALEQAGFGWSMDGEVDSSQPKGTIGSQSATGQAPRGSAISLKTSRGNQSGVPDVTGMQADQAEAALTAAGFRVERNEEDTADPSKIGFVLSQSPGSGENAKAGSKVTIVVGRLGNGGDGGGNPPDNG